jgi:hypothetical protein
MPGKLQNFLSELAVSPEKLASYQKNPDAAMKEAGLDADEIAALKSGDPARVYASLAGPTASGGQPQPNCIWGAQPQTGCIYAAQPQAGCIYAAQPQAGCIYAAQPQANCIYAAQPQANCIYAAQPFANCIYAAQPQAGCIYAAQPQAGCIYAAQPPAPTIWAAQPCTIVVHHFIHHVQPTGQPAAPSETSQPSSQSPEGKSTTGKTS